MRLLFILSLLINCLQGCTEKQKGFLLSEWLAEDASGELQMTCVNDTLEIVSPDGLTLWFKRRLTGDYEIDYHIQVLMQGGAHDRLSDLNCFCKADDPLFPDNLFARGDWRGGVFAHYNTLNLYYAGYGGNENTTTRFREYHGELYGVDDARLKPVLREYKDDAHLLKPNHWYHMHISVAQGITTYSVDGEELFRHAAPHGKADGHFGLRLLKNHVRLTGFRIKQ